MPSGACRVSEDPGFIIRVAQVMTFFPGASPERVEQLVTDKLEKTIQEMPELDFVTSTSRGGVSLVFPQILASETEMRRTWIRCGARWSAPVASSRLTSSVPL